MGNTIEFYEGKPFTDDYFTLYPVYMKKDGKEHFIINRRDGQSEQLNYQDECLKKELLSNNGIYCKFHGYYSNPLDMLREMAGRRQHFENSANLFSDFYESYGYYKFGGSRTELPADSAKFEYRFYDTNAFAAFKKIVIDILNENWSAAIEEIVAYEKKMNIAS